MSVMRNRLRKLSSQLGSWARRNAERVAVAATRPFQEVLPAGREYLDLREHLLCLGGELETMFAELVRYEDLLEHHRGLLRRLRDQRGSLVAELRGELQAVADALGSVWGRAVVRCFFSGSSSLPADPRALVLVARRCFAALSDPAVELPPPRWGRPPDLEAMARAVKGPMEGLDETLAALSEGEAAERHAQSSKDESKARLTEHATRVKRYCEALAEVSGQGRTAKQLRRSLRP